MWHALSCSGRACKKRRVKRTQNWIIRQKTEFSVRAAQILCHKKPKLEQCLEDEILDLLKLSSSRSTGDVFPILAKGARNFADFADSTRWWNTHTANCQLTFCALPKSACLPDFRRSVAACGGKTTPCMHAKRRKNLYSAASSAANQPTPFHLLYHPLWK